MKFDKKRYERLINDYEKWWNHELDRPIIQVTLEPETSKFPSGELLGMCYDTTVDPITVAKSYEEWFDEQEYLGDAFPFFYLRTTGVLGAYMGQDFKVDTVNGRGTVWFEEMHGVNIEDMNPTLDTQSALFLHHIQILQAFQKHFNCDVPLGIANLGGIMDIVESMRGATNSLMDLLDHPEEVKRLNDIILGHFFEAADAQFNTIKRENIPGYTGWISLLSDKPFFISQCDFCFMIGPDEYKEYVHETLAKEAKHFERVFYHLDGPGQIIHLDEILKIEEIDGIQWINGAGSAPIYDPKWFDIYRKVISAGKLLQVYCYNIEELNHIDEIVQAVGSAKGMCFICRGKQHEKEKFVSILNKYNVPIE